MRVPLSWSKVQLDTDVDACHHGQQVCEGKLQSHCVGPALRQVDDLKRKFASANAAVRARRSWAPRSLMATCGTVGVDRRKPCCVHTSWSILRELATVWTDAVFLEQTFEWAGPSGGLSSLEGARVQRSQAWGMDRGGLLTGEGGDVLIVTIRHTRRSRYLHLLLHRVGVLESSGLWLCP